MAMNYIYNLVCKYFLKGDPLGFKRNRKNDGNYMQSPMIGVENIFQLLATEVKKRLVRKMSSPTETVEKMLFERGLEFRKKTKI